MKATLDKTPAEQSKDQAAKQVQLLLTEREALQHRKTTAGEEATRLNEDIAKAERAGAEGKTLTALRRDRTEQQQMRADLDRVLDNIERELVHARAQLEDAEKACKAEQYNAIVQQQCALAELIDEALDTLVESLRVKEGLATTQKRRQGDVGCPQHGLSPDGMRMKIRDALTPWLQGAEMRKGTRTPFREQDWSCRRMHPAGHLEPYTKQEPEERRHGE